MQNLRAIRSAIRRPFLEKKTLGGLVTPPPPLQLGELKNKYAEFNVFFKRTLTCGLKHCLFYGNIYHRRCIEKIRPPPPLSQRRLGWGVKVYQ